MGRTLYTATDLIRRERGAWKPFRQQLSKKERPLFDDMFNIAHIFNYAQMMAMPEHPVPLQPILMSMVLYHYKQLTRIQKEMESSK